MLSQDEVLCQSKNRFFFAIKELFIGRLLRQANIHKSCGIPIIELFQSLILLVFHGKNLFRFLQSSHSDHSISQNAFYRFLSNPSYNWNRFLLLLAIKITQAFHPLTRTERVKMLVLDDSVAPRNRSKSVELLARIYDHVSHRYLRGFNLLALGWTDGFSFVPVAFNLLPSANQRNRYQEADADVDHRTNGWKARTNSMLKKTEAALQMIRKVLDASIEADYILMDSWFTTEPFVQELRTIGIHVIGMVKNNKQSYQYKGHFIHCLSYPDWLYVKVRDHNIDHHCSDCAMNFRLAAMMRP